MPNHWHFVLWPQGDGDLSEFMRWLTVTHTQRWHAAHHTAGTGPLYQGRFKSFPIQADDHLLTVLRYVERNALRANLVERADGVALVEPLASRARRGGRASGRRAAGLAAGLAAAGAVAGDRGGVGGPAAIGRAWGPVWRRVMAIANRQASRFAIDLAPARSALETSPMSTADLRLPTPLFFAFVLSPPENGRAPGHPQKHELPAAFLQPPPQAMISKAAEGRAVTPERSKGRGKAAHRRSG